jgi:uncharacterized protein
MRISAAILGVITATAFCAPAQAASFNCNRAQLPAEIAICGTGALHDLDERMAALYFELMDDAPGWAIRQIQAEQRRWLDIRNGCGYNIRCLRRQHLRRIDHLEDWDDRLGV